MSLNKRMDEDNVFHLYNEVYYPFIKNIEVMKFTGKLMELDKDILSEIS